jgi:hypothetical protein
MSGHGSKLPHLLHTANCSQLEITLQGVETSDNFEGKSRFALEVLFASNEQKGTAANVSEHRSLDDEHTPGVFAVSKGSKKYVIILIINLLLLILLKCVTFLLLIYPFLF